ncbi:MAG TPA: peptidoglycan DD-metalloendopeptidase family protein [Moraxellaceae bacterium]
MRSCRSENATPLLRQGVAFSWLLLGLAVFTLSLPLPVQAETARKTTGSQASSKSKSAAPKKSTQKKSASKKKQGSKPAARKKTGSSSAGNNARHDLDRVQEQIRSAEQRIKLTKEQREQKEAELRQAEIEIGELKGSVGSVQQDVSTREQALRRLQQQKAEQLQSRDRLVNLIRADLQMAQRQGGQDYYKLLLNQQDPQQLARLMKYYGYMQQARAGRVQELNSTLAQLEDITRQEEAAVQKLRDLRGELQQKQSKLNVAQEQRSRAIRTLSAQLETEDERLRKLRQDQQALQAVMDRLAREAAEREAERRRQEQQRLEQQKQAQQKQAQQAQTPRAAGSKPETATRPVVEESRPDFREMPYKGRCPLPVAGGVRSSFGSARAGGLRWNGIVIGAAAGTSVRAIRPGRVAFADYLRGYGFLIIVDHGRGLMSLYGQNQSLQKKAGEEVAGNEVIATVGDSGGNDADGLYFEIRVRGRPSDPANWCAYQ